MNRPPELRAHFPCTLGGVEAFCRQFRHWFEEHCQPGDAFASELLLREALGNSVAHAPGAVELEADDLEADLPDERMACDASMCCVVRGGPKRLLITVRDEGPGFDWRAKGHIPETEASHGRGIAIYYRYAHRVRFNLHSP